MIDYAALKENLSTSFYFKPKEGEYTLRVVTEPLQIWKVGPKNGWAKGSVRTYLSEKSVKVNPGDEVNKKFLMYVFNRSEGNRLQLAEFGTGIMSKFVNLATSTRYGFSSLPPYDMILTKTGDKKTSKYELQPDRSDSALTLDEINTLNSAKSILDILKSDETVVWEEPATNQANAPEAPKNDIDLSQVPF